MSAPAWLMDAIYATKSECVPNVPNRKNHHWEQADNRGYLTDKGFTNNVPIVPNVPREMRSSWDRVEVADKQRECRRAKVLRMMEGKRFAVLVEDGNTDPIIATVGIQNLASFELAIPQHLYDGIAVLELIETHSGEYYANS